MSTREFADILKERVGDKKKPAPRKEPPQEPTEALPLMTHDSDSFDLDTNMELLQGFIDGLLKRLEALKDKPERYSELAGALRDVCNETLQQVNAAA
jgi:hypothetical protein